MANEHEIAPEELAEPETEAAREETPLSQPESEPDEGAEEAPQSEPDVPAAAEAESEAGCAMKMGWQDGRRCGHKVHAAPVEIDERPVCLMHSNDPNKQSGPLFDAFWLEFEMILDEAGENEAHFDRFVFPRADFSVRKFKAICRFYCATFTRWANFGHVTFTQNADFSGATFTKDAEFRAAIFTQNADFTRATFTQETIFFDATFTQDAKFVRATFMQDANFIRATFKQNADFYGATFTQNADFEFTKFYGTAKWRWCRFLDQAEFRDIKFLAKEPKAPSAVFSMTRFTKPGEIVFEYVDLSRVLFLNCDVSAVWFTSSVKWARRIGYRGFAVFEEKILLDPVLSKEIWEFGTIDHGAVEQIYHQLQKNYDARLDYRMANNFHYGEMEMRRLEPPADGPFIDLRWILPRWMNLLTLYRLASDYGNSYAKPGAWLLVTLLAATLLFPILGLEQKQPKPGNPAGNAIVTYSSVWNRQDTYTNNRWTEAKLVIKSGITAIDTATFQRNPEYTPVYPRGRILGILETLLTSSLFALFLLAIRRQFRR